MPKPDNQPATPQPEVIEPTPTGEPKVVLTNVLSTEGHLSGRPDETVPGGMIVARVNGGRHYQVQNAEGTAIPGKAFDPVKKCIVDA